MSDADKDARKAQRQESFYTGVRGGRWLYHDEITEWDQDRYEKLTQRLSDSVVDSLVSTMTGRRARKKKKTKTSREPQKAFPWRKSRWRL